MLYPAAGFARRIVHGEGKVFYGDKIWHHTSIPIAVDKQTGRVQVMGMGRKEEDWMTIVAWGIGRNGDGTYGPTHAPTQAAATQARDQLRNDDGTYGPLHMIRHCDAVRALVPGNASQSGAGASQSGAGTSGG